MFRPRQNGRHFGRRHFQMNFTGWKWDSYSNFTEMCFKDCNWQNAGIGSGNGLIVEQATSHYLNQRRPSLPLHLCDTSSIKGYIWCNLTTLALRQPSHRQCHVSNALPWKLTPPSICNNQLYYKVTPRVILLWLPSHFATTGLHCKMTPNFEMTPNKQYYTSYVGNNLCFFL